jgi:hypothetical protein
MIKMVKIFAFFGAILALNGCTPAFEIFGRGPAATPSGPKITSLLNNLHCELWRSAQSVERIPFHRNDPENPQDLFFDLRRFFNTIAYVGQANFLLEVTHTGGVNPSLNFIHPFTTPQTDLTLAVGGKFSDAAHRTFTFDTAVDFASLDAKPAAAIEGAAIASRCSTGSELAGTLGLHEILSMGVAAAVSNGLGIAAKRGGGGTPDPGDDVFGFGKFGSVIDFSITQNVSGGPNWTLTRFKGPGEGLLNFERTVKDTLTISFVPACIRVRYAPDVDPEKGPPYRFWPPLPPEAPEWAAYLPSCQVEAEPEKPAKAQVTAKGRALRAGAAFNTLQYLQRIVPLNR